MDTKARRAEKKNKGNKNIHNNDGYHQPKRKNELRKKENKILIMNSIDISIFHRSMNFHSGCE